MSEDEGNLFSGTRVSQTVPVKGRFATEDKVAAKRFDIAEEFIGLTSFVVAAQVFFAGLVDDAGVHLVGVQVDCQTERAQ